MPEGQLQAAGAVGGIPGLQRESGGGPTKIPFAIQGTTSDPKFVPEVRAMAASAVTGIVKSQAGKALPNTPVSRALGGLLGQKKPQNK